MLASTGASIHEGYHHLTGDERCQIHTLSGESKAGIARRLGRHPAGRELSRNADEDSYDFKKADRLATGCRGAASKRPRKMTPDRWREVEEKLALQWSSEQISGRLEGRFTVSHEWIYRHVWKDRDVGGTLHLRRRGKKRTPGGRRAVAAVAWTSPSARRSSRRSRGSGTGRAT